MRDVSIVYYVSIFRHYYGFHLQFDNRIIIWSKLYCGSILHFFLFLHWKQEYHFPVSLCSNVRTVPSRALIINDRTVPSRALIINDQ